MYEQGLLQDDFEKPAFGSVPDDLGDVQGALARQHNHTPLQGGCTDSSTRVRAALERVQWSRFKVCRSRAALESTWLTWAVHCRSEVRTKPRCLCILTFFRVLPLRLIATVGEERASCELHQHCLVHVDGWLPV